MPHADPDTEAGGAPTCYRPTMLEWWARISSGNDYCAQKCAHLSSKGTDAGRPFGDMNGRQFITRVRKWARSRNLEARFVASEGAGSHGTLYAGDCRTTVKDRKKEIGQGLLGKMLSDLGIDKDEF